jgi:hypothetical protein
LNIEKCVDKLYCRPGWSIDQLTISNGLGLKLSYCKDTGELLPSGIPIARQVTLTASSHSQAGHAYS